MAEAGGSGACGDGLSVGDWLAWYGEEPSAACLGLLALAGHGDDGDAEDVAEEAVVRVIAWASSPARTLRSTPLAAHYAGIARNICHEQRRQRRRRAVTSSALDTLPAPAAGPEDGRFDATELDLSCLQDRERELIGLLTTTRCLRKVAERTGLPRCDVKILLDRAAARLRAQREQRPAWAFWLLRRRCLAPKDRSLAEAILRGVPSEEAGRPHGMSANAVRHWVERKKLESRHSRPPESHL